MYTNLKHLTITKQVLTICPNFSKAELESIQLSKAELYVHISQRIKSSIPKLKTELEQQKSQKIHNYTLKYKNFKD